MNDRARGDRDDWSDQDLLTIDEARERLRAGIAEERARIASLEDDLASPQPRGGPSRDETGRLLEQARRRLAALEERVHDGT